MSSAASSALTRPAPGSCAGRGTRSPGRTSRSPAPAPPMPGPPSRSTRSATSVFIPTGSAAPDYYGGVRPGDNEHANSVVALKASTGELVWSFQVVHHDLWDYDVASRPVLIDFQGRPAVAVTTKMGNLFVLDRVNGKPLDESGGAARAQERRPRRRGVAHPAVSRVARDGPAETLAGRPLGPHCRRPASIAASSPDRCATMACSRRPVCRARSFFPATSAA